MKTDATDRETASSSTRSLSNTQNRLLSRSKNEVLKAVIRITLITGMLMTAFAVVGWFVIPSAQRAMEDRIRLGSISNIQQIAKALNAYRLDHGTYPTPIVTDSSDKPLYSWRVLVLPYLGYRGLYNRFQLNQPWDSPTNSLLAREMPPVFVVAGNNMALSLYESNYALVVGPGTLFPTPFLDSVEEVVDDPSETILLAETKEGGLTWTEPGNLDNFKGVGIGTRPTTDIGGNFENFVLVATVDGTAIALSPQTSIATIQAMLSPDGGESVSIETFNQDAPLP
jgi:hypothetical protein